jgi:UDP-2-acetamido-2,6-beta-L-arabino-hexul-4-ose reductase
MKVLITGANGFVGKNLQLHLAARKYVQVVCFTRDDDLAQLPQFLLQGLILCFTWLVLTARKTRQSLSRAMWI